MLTDFKRPSFEEVKNGVDADLRRVFGDGVNLSPDSVLGQLSGIFCYRMNDLFQQVELAYNNAFPHTASGRALDRFADLTGVVRQGSSRLDVALYVWIQGGELPSLGDVLTSNGTQFTVVDVEPGSISDAEMVAFGYPFERSAIEVDNVSIVLGSDGNGLTDGASDLRDAGVDWEVSNGLITAWGTTRQRLNISYIRSASKFSYHRVTVTGDRHVGAGSQWTVPVGWGEKVSVRQPFESSGGAGAEPDESYRARILLPRSTSGLGTVDTMQNYMAGIPGVTFCSVEENATGEAREDGMPPNSVRFIISGSASDDDIVKGIMYCKPAGIGTFGKHVHLGISWDIASGSNNTLTVTVESWMPDAVPSDYPTREMIERNVRTQIAGITRGQDVSPFRIAAHVTQTFPAINVCNVQINGRSDVLQQDSSLTFVVNTITINLP